MILTLDIGQTVIDWVLKFIVIGAWSLIGLGVIGAILLILCIIGITKKKRNRHNENT